VSSLLRNIHLERIQKRSEELWKNFITSKGISGKLPPELFWLEMQLKRNRIMNTLKSGVLSKPMENMMGTANYFIVNNLARGEVCEKCHNSGIVIFLSDSDYLSGMEEKIFIPCFETYYALKIQPEGHVFAENFPIPINCETDYWYCPHCNELHKFRYDEELGLEYDQEVIDIKKLFQSSRLMEEHKDAINGILELHLLMENNLKREQDKSNIKPTFMQISQAKKTNRPVLISKWMEKCNDPDEECSCDIVYKYVLPNGKIKFERTHTY
jgi:hypothetical protein